MGNRKQTTDADNKTTLIQYQSFDEPDYSRPLQITAQENQSTVIARDRFGKITSVTQSGPFQSGTLSYTRQYRYDDYQRLCGRFDPESGSTGWGYDLASQMSWELKGQTATSCVTSIPPPATRYSYDLRGRKTRVDYPGTATDVDYGYDAKGNLTSVSNPTALWTYSYNKRNLPESEQAQIDGRTYLLDPSYNAMAQVTSTSYPGLGAIAYAPNAFGQPTRVSNYATSALYHPNGQVKSYTLGNGLSYSQTLDSRQRLNLQSTLRGGTAIQRLAYSYSNADDLTAIDDQVDNTDDATLSYDGLHRLTGATGLWGGYTYSYDPINNLRSRTGTNALSYSYDSAKNRLSGVSGSASRNYGYDARGQITSDGSRSFIWNEADQIASIPGVASYSYDGNGRRIKTVKAGGEVEYSFYSLSGALFFSDRPAFDKTTVFLKMAGQPLVNITLENGSPSITTYLHPDLLGSPRLATNESSNIAYTEHYSPYGEKLNNFNSYLGYTGHVQDYDAGLVYAQARFYDPLVGRFLSIDPVYFSDQSSFTFNRYSYANNNPYRYVDPDGRECVSKNGTTVCTIAQPGSRIKQQVKFATPNGFPSKVSDRQLSALSSYLKENPNVNLDSMAPCTCSGQGTAPSPQDYEKMGEYAGKLLKYTGPYGLGFNMGLAMEFKRGGFLDAQVRYEGTPEYANYVFGVYMAALGANLSLTLTAANIYGALASEYPPTTFMSPQYQSIPATNVLNITQGFQDQQNGALCCGN